MVVEFDRIAFTIFGWGIHWYGLMYVFAFLSAWWLARLQTKRQYTDWNYVQIDFFIFPLLPLFNQNSLGTVSFNALSV